MTSSILVLYLFFVRTFGIHSVLACRTGLSQNSGRESIRILCPGAEGGRLTTGGHSGVLVVWAKGELEGT